MKYARIYSPKHMVSDLREERIDKREFSIYIALFVLACIPSLLIVFGPASGAMLYRPTYLALVDRILLLVLSICSILLAYYANIRGDGQRFWYRYISLTVPVGVVVGVTGFVLFAFAALLGIINTDYYGFADLLIYVVLYGFGLLVVWESMRRISAKKPRPKSNFFQRLLF